MGERTAEVSSADHDLPFLRLVSHLLLARLKTPQVFTEVEVRDVQAQYHGMRTIYNPADGTFTLALKPIVRSEGPG